MEKKLTKKTLTKSFHNWYYGNLTCFSQEHMQTFGYLCSMLPVVNELYDKQEDKAKAMQTYTAFFNTEPQIGSVIVGMTAGLEEARANGDDVDDETINVLERWRKVQVANSDDNYILSKFGEPMVKSTLTRMLKRQAKLAGVPEITGKGLRHSHDSFMINILGKKCFSSLSTFR